MLTRREAIFHGVALYGASSVAMAHSPDRFDRPASYYTRADRERFTVTDQNWPVSMASPNKPYSYASWNDRHRFELRKGDVCVSIDGAHAGQKGCPERCLIVWDQARPFFRAARFGFDFMVALDGPNFNPWTLLAQYHNHADVLPSGDFEPWCSPPLAIMLAPDPARRGQTVLTVSGRVIREKSTKKCPTEMILGRVPFTFDVNHRIDVIFVNGRGGPGFVRAVMDGAVIADYRGLTGFNDDVGCYFSFGAYRSPMHKDNQNIIASFANVMEGTAS